MLTIGDWVTQYSKGYWQIVDIKPKYAQVDNLFGDGHKKGDITGYWVIMKKGFTPKMKFRVESGCCDSYWCRPVSDEIRAQIILHFENNPKDYEKFKNSAVDDHFSASVTWLNLSPEQVIVFKKAVAELPSRFTVQSAMKVFRKYCLDECFTKPPTNYRFVCWSSLWEVDENFEYLYKDPELKQKDDR